MKKFTVLTLLLVFCLGIAYAFSDTTASDVFEIVKRKKSKKIEQIVLCYPSVDAQGNRVMVSGGVFMQKGATHFDEIILACHQTSLGPNQLPSTDCVGFTDINICKKSPNTLVIAPDYFGHGMTSQHTHPYMNHTMCAHNAIDMLRAALPYLKSRGYTFASPQDSLRTYFTGFSQGAAVTLAAQREIEKDEAFCKQINFQGSFCGEGPYSMTETFDYYREKDHVGMPLVLPYVIIGMYESYPEEFKGIDINRYFSEKIIKLGMIDHLRNKTKQGLPLFIENFKLKKKYTSIASDEAQNPDSEIMQVLLRCIKRQDLTDGSWMPKHRVVLFHSKDDTVVPYINCESALKAFAPSGLVTAPDIAGKHDHLMELIPYTKCVTNGTFRDYMREK